VQPLFLIRHPAAFFTYEFRTADYGYKFIKFFGYIVFFPLAQTFFLFSHCGLPLPKRMQTRYPDRFSLTSVSVKACRVAGKICRKKIGKFVFIFKCRPIKKIFAVSDKHFTAFSTACLAKESDSDKILFQHLIRREHPLIAAPFWSHNHQIGLKFLGQSDRIYQGFLRIFRKVASYRNFTKIYHCFPPLSIPVR
jgi:hypothetical protein